jgi:hypothetical protein
MAVARIFDSCFRAKDIRPVSDGRALRTLTLQATRVDFFRTNSLLQTPHQEQREQQGQQQGQQQESTHFHQLAVEGGEVLQLSM